MLTGHDTDSDTILGLESGANDYVTKPFRFAVLLAHIRAQLRQHEASENAIFTVGPYTFRPSSKLLLNHKGNKVRLTEKETSILRYLYRAGERPVSREVPLQEVWGYNSGVTTHTALMPNTCKILIVDRLSLFQIERIEAFGKPAVDRSEKIARLIPLALTDRSLEAVLAQDAHRLAAVDVGQPDVHDHQIDLPRLGRRSRDARCTDRTTVAARGVRGDRRGERQQGRAGAAGNAHLPVTAEDRKGCRSAGHPGHRGRGLQAGAVIAT
jgi:hypothetical protein